MATKSSYENHINIAPQPRSEQPVLFVCTHETLSYYILARHNVISPLESTKMELWNKSATVDPEVRAYVYSLVNAVGGRTTGDDEKYALGDDALATLKDIRRWLLLYDERNNRLDVKRILAEANLVKGDLLEILTLWKDDAPEAGLRSKLAFVCLELLVPLTLPIDLEEETASVNTHRHLPYLKLAQVSYKRSILHHEGCEVLRKVVRVALPCMAKPKADRTRRDEGTIMLMMFLLRNIAMITQPQHLPSQGDENDISRVAVINAFHKQDILNLLLTLGSAVNDEFSEHDVELLDVLYHLLKGIDSRKLFLDKAQVTKSETNEFRDLLNKEKNMLKSYNKIAPTRHNRFGTMLWVKQEDDKLATVTGQASITNQQALSEQMDVTKKWNRPKYRGRAAHEAETDNDFGQRIDLDDKTTAQLKSFVEDFLDSSFNPMFTSLRKAIEREVDRVKEENKKQYFYLIRWFLGAEAVRRSVKKSSTTEAVNDDNAFTYIAAVLDQETFVLLNRSMQQAYDEKDWQKLQSALQAFTQILLTVQRMSESTNEDDQEIADNILNRIFYEESTHDRIATVLRNYNGQGFAYLDAVTECVHVFVRMLEQYSKQNADMQIRSKRRARRKAKTQAGPTNQDTAQDEADEVEEEEREAFRTASERKFDFTRFVSKYLNQGCVNTFTAFIQYYNEMTTDQLKRCHRYFYRLAFKADLSILLFRVDVLSLFQRMIKGPGGMSPQITSFGDWDQLVRQVFRKCIKWLSKEVDGQGWKEMCVVEMLFSKTPNTHFYLQNAYEVVVEKRAPRAPAELEFKAHVAVEHRIATAVSVVVDKARSDDLRWIKEQLQRCVDERRSWEDVQQAPQSLSADDEPVNEAPSPPIIILSPDTEERKLSLFKDKFLRLLMSTLGFERLGLAEDVDASWYAPGFLTSTQLAQNLDAVRKAEFDPPTYEDGKTAEDMVRNKSANRPRAATSEIESGGEDDAMAVDSNGEAFPPNMREKRKRVNGASGSKKRRRVSGSADVEADSLSDIERRAEARLRREREKNAKIKSKLFVTDSDDEEGDADFFRLEEERRKVMRGVIQKALTAQKRKDKQKSKRNRAPEDSERSGHEDDSEADATGESDTEVMEAAVVNKTIARRPLFDNLSDDSDDELMPSDEATPRQDASSATSIEKPGLSPLKELSSNAVRGRAPLFDSDDEDEPVVKVVARRRAVVLDDSD